MAILMLRSRSPWCCFFWFFGGQHQPDISDTQTMCFIHNCPDLTEFQLLSTSNHEHWLGRKASGTAEDRWKYTLAKCSGVQPKLIVA